MKIFHTADWHIGKVLLHRSFIDEQREVLEKFIDRVRSENPDLIIVAGDIYDKSIPTIEAIDLLNRTLKKLVMEMGKKVVMISGNHDSADRLSFGADMLKENGLYIATDIESSLNPIELEDEHGRVNVYAIPYISPMKARAVFQEEEIRNHDDIARVVMKKIKRNWDETARNICVYHGFITKSGEDRMESESERPLSIGGSDEVDADYFKDFDYVALGHLHGPQKVKCENIRYSGSLMRYSFSEVVQKKGITEVVLGRKEDGETEFSYRLKEIYPTRGMQIVEGTLEEILEKSPSESERDNYTMVRLVADGELYSPKTKLDKLYRNILRVEVKRSEADCEKSEKKSSSRDYREKDLLELFMDFYRDATERELSDEKEGRFRDVLKKLELEEE